MSDRPEHTKPASGSAEPGSRRRFLTWLSRALLGLWGLGAAGVIASYIRVPGGAHGSDRIVRVGPLEELEIGHGRLVHHGVTPFFVVRLDAERVIALSAVCTHVRCILDFDRKRQALVCPCHDGLFDLSGKVISGPPPRPLTSYPVSVRAGDVYVRV